MVAELCQPRPTRKPGPFSARNSDMPRWRGSAVGVGLDQQRKAGAADAVGDPGLGAVDHVALALAHGAGPDRLQVGAAVGLGQRQPAAQLAGRKARQEPSLLRLSAEALDQLRHDQVGVEIAGQRDPDLGDPGDDRGRRSAPTAQARRARGAIVAPNRPNACICSISAARISIGPLQLDHLRADLALEPALDRVEDLALVASRSTHSGALMTSVAARSAAAILSSTAWPRLGISMVRLNVITSVPSALYARVCDRDDALGRPRVRSRVSPAPRIRRTACRR